MPFFSFRSEHGISLRRRLKIISFCAACIQRGVWFHPFHTMFLCAAHGDRDIAETLAVTEHAFAVVAGQAAKL